MIFIIVAGFMSKISIRKETCELCQNNCAISFAEIEGLDEAPSWGYMCGRDPEENKVRVNPHEKPLRIRQRLWREGGGGPALPVVTMTAWHMLITVGQLRVGEYALILGAGGGVATMGIQIAPPSSER